MANLVDLSQLQTEVLYNDFQEKIEHFDETIVLTERWEIRMLCKIKKLLLISLVFFIISAGDAQAEKLSKPNDIVYASSLDKDGQAILPPRSFNNSLFSSNGPSAITASPTLRPTWKYLEFGSIPPPRIGFSLTLNPLNEIAILFGGKSSTSGELNDLWLTDGSGWIQFQSPHSPSGRHGSNMTYDEARQEVFLFGGGDAGGLLGDTWSFDGVDWTQQYPAHTPPPRSGASMAYDPDRNVVVLFGGWGDTGGMDWEALNDTWVWDGADWKQQFPASLPPARFGASLVYDPARHAMLLFGGGEGGGLLDDTWIWDGADWSEQQPALHPPARADFGMVYDESRQMVILYGGQAQAFTDRTETWAWDGDDWVLLPTIQSPPERLSYMAKLVYMPGLETVILVNDLREIIELPDGTIVFTEWMEVWALTDQYVNFLPLVTQK
jgi:hypothetical protein